MSYCTCEITGRGQLHQKLATCPTKERTVTTAYTEYDMDEAAIQAAEDAMLAAEYKAEQEAEWEAEQRAEYEAECLYRERLFAEEGRFSSLD